MICHSCQTLFVHIPKTAGQSIEQVFLEHVGLDWKRRAPLLLRPRFDGESGPPRLAHLRVVEYLRYGYITPKRFGMYFTFSIVRNPWDRMLSFYRYLGYAERMEFDAFIELFLQKWRQEKHYWFVRPQIDYLTTETGEIGVKYVGRFERLQESFDEICRHLGWESRPLPRSNVSATETASYRTYYTDRTRRIVARIYQRDLEAFGYRF